MQKKLRRLRLDRETVRTLTPDSLDAAAGGGIIPTVNDSYVNSCDPASTSRIRTGCESAFIVVSLCQGC